MTNWENIPVTHPLACTVGMAVHRSLLGRGDHQFSHVFESREEVAWKELK